MSLFVTVLAQTTLPMVSTPSETTGGADNSTSKEFYYFTRAVLSTPRTAFVCTCVSGNRRERYIFALRDFPKRARAKVGLISGSFIELYCNVLRICFI